MQRLQGFLVQLLGIILRRLQPKQRNIGRLVVHSIFPGSFPQRGRIRHHVKNVIDNLVTVMTRHLQSSESVTLDGLGTFRLTMKSTMNGVEDPLKVSATQSTLRVRFLPTSKRNLDHTVSTRSLVTGVKCVRFDLQDTAGSGGNDGGSGGNDGDQGENPLG